MKKLMLAVLAIAALLGAMSRYFAQDDTDPDEFFMEDW
jgi:hypothetical protein